MIGSTEWFKPEIVSLIISLIIHLEWLRKKHNKLWNKNLRGTSRVPLIISSLYNMLIKSGVIFSREYLSIEFSVFVWQGYFSRMMEKGRSCFSVYLLWENLSVDHTPSSHPRTLASPSSPLRALDFPSSPRTLAPLSTNKTVFTQSINDPSFCVRLSVVPWEINVDTDLRNVKHGFIHLTN